MAFRDNTKDKKAIFPGFGSICAILSAMFYCADAVMVKLINLPPTQLNFLRCSIQFLIILPVFQREFKTVDILGPKTLRLLLLARTIITSFAGIFLFLAISKLPVGDAVAIQYLYIIIVPLVAWVFLKERASIIDIVFALVSLCGVVLIAQPTFLFPVQDDKEASSITGVIFALLCAICVAVTICILRKLGPETYPPLILLHSSWCGSIISMIIAFASEQVQFPCWHELPLLLMIGCLGLFAQIFITVALKTERAGTVSILSSTEIIFVYIFQALLLGDIPSAPSLVGALLILSCAIGIGIRKLITSGKKKRNDYGIVSRKWVYKRLSGEAEG